MGLTVTLQRHENTACGKEAWLLCKFDNSYATGGETLDLTADPLTGALAFTSVVAVEIVEGPHAATTYAPIAQTVCSKVQYVAAASRAVATGVLYAFAEDGTSGVTSQASGDLSTVYVQVHVVGA